MTEPDYFQIVAEGVALDFARSGQVPKSLVDQAWEDLKKNRRKRMRDRDFDQIWCVFDRDEHEDISGTLQTARDRDIPVAYSNPCFELWLVLHATEQSAPVERGAIQRRSHELGLTEGKHIARDAAELLRGGYDDAKRRACELAVMHEQSDSPEWNPSSDVWRLVDQLRP